MAGGTRSSGYRAAVGKGGVCRTRGSYWSYSRGKGRVRGVSFTPEVLGGSHSEVCSGRFYSKVLVEGAWICSPESSIWLVNSKGFEVLFQVGTIFR